VSRKEAYREPDALIKGMAHYLVRAIPRQGALKRIWKDLESGRMVYAPRDEAEVTTVTEVVLLSYWRAKGANVPGPGSLA
jgi:hypothetical protein